MATTIKDIVNDLDAFVQIHPQINEFGFGNLANITTKDHLFVMMWLMLDNISYKGEDNTTTVLSFQMHIMDLWDGTQEHSLQLVNNLIIIGNDVIVKFFRDNNDLDFEIDETSVTVTPYEGKFDDLVIDIVFNFDIEMPTNITECIIPID